MMNSWRLFRWVLGRGVLSGMILGALFGWAITSPYIITGSIGICFISLIVGGLFGSVLGGILGVINGATLVFLSCLFPHPIRNLRHYHWSALLVAVICTIPASFTTTYLLFGNIAFVFIPVTALATAVAAHFAWRLPDAVAPTAPRSRPANAVLFYLEK